MLARTSYSSTSFFCSLTFPLGCCMIVARFRSCSLPSHYSVSSHVLMARFSSTISHSTASFLFSHKPVYSLRHGVTLPRVFLFWPLPLPSSTLPPVHPFMLHIVWYCLFGMSSSSHCLHHSIASIHPSGLPSIIFFPRLVPSCLLSLHLSHCVLPLPYSHNALFPLLPLFIPSSILSPLRSRVSPLCSSICSDYSCPCTKRSSFVREGLRRLSPQIDIYPSSSS